MAFNADISSGRMTAGGDPRVRMVSARSDLFPRLIAMQKALGARSFAVFRVAGSGLPRKRSLHCDFESWTVGVNSDAFIGCYGDLLLTHLDDLLLPLVWSSKDEVVCCGSRSFTAFMSRLPTTSLSYGGIAFPVRLGTVGNGYVIFAFQATVDLSADVIIDIHNRCCRLMVDLIAVSERKNAPSEALSDREIACLQLAGDGRISEEIAENLGLSVHTVNAYLGSATIKLDSVNRIQAIAKAIRLGYIT
ncbi:helix-turn-helix transcriptional regulator [Allorhizobium sp. BGMRC 0089]|uniref:transcriptional regulator VisR n=1 Tax=Allorhizobium sonneratiae TaxID=2934936 RepID=UPI00203391DA|nr:helix-turn-helix transcriptional regulator [Allorhizobium sonneratiae]MCM2293463.1 helix-turn-helix transcriptional regulator [Allorhizobium sonneratiae]